MLPGWKRQCGLILYDTASESHAEFIDLVLHYLYRSQQVLSIWLHNSLKCPSGGRGTIKPGLENAFLPLKCQHFSSDSLILVFILLSPLLFLTPQNVPAGVVRIMNQYLIWLISHNNDRRSRYGQQRPEVLAANDETQTRSRIKTRTTWKLTWFIASDCSFLIDSSSQSLAWCLLHDFISTCADGMLLCVLPIWRGSQGLCPPCMLPVETHAAAAPKSSKGRWKPRGCLSNFSLEAVWRATTLASPTRDSNQSQLRFNHPSNVSLCCRLLNEYVSPVLICELSRSAGQLKGFRSRKLLVWIPEPLSTWDPPQFVLARTFSIEINMVNILLWLCSVKSAIDIIFSFKP